jgi:predicted RNase H-like nuclease (RuvC/YqgF family)
MNWRQQQQEETNARLSGGKENTSQKQQIEELQKAIEGIKKDIEELLKRTSNIQASPLIQGYQGMKLELNTGLNVVNLFKRISDAEARITALEAI